MKAGQTYERRVLIGRKDANNNHLALPATGALVHLPVKKPLFGQAFTLGPGKEQPLFEPQRLTSPGKIPCLTGVGQEAELPDFAKARRQKVQTKPMEELDAGQRHFLLFGAISIVLIRESNIVPVNVEYTSIGNGHPMRIPGQVFDYVMHPGKGLFGENHPFLLVEILLPAIESGALSWNFLRQRKGADGDKLFELFEKKGLKNLFHR